MPPGDSWSGAIARYLLPARAAVLGAPQAFAPRSGIDFPGQPARRQPAFRREKDGYPATRASNAFIVHFVRATRHIGDSLPGRAAIEGHQ